MGCCVSTSKKQSQQLQDSPRSSRTPPPSTVEETVKEIVTISANYQQKHGQQDSKVAKPGILKSKGNQKGVQNCTKEEIFEAQFDTSAATQRKDYNEASEVRQVVNISPAKLPPTNRSLSGEMGPKRERLVAKSPSRRFEQSPGRINGVPVRREPGRVSPGSRIELGWRDPGESSGRRSRSPGTRVIDGSGGMNLGRTPSARRTNQSPGRVNRNSNPIPNRHPESDTSKVVEESNAVESLENPLVSLECFIFL